MEHDTPRPRIERHRRPQDLLDWLATYALRAEDDPQGKNDFKQKRYSASEPAPVSDYARAQQRARIANAEILDVRFRPEDDASDNDPSAV